MNDAVLKYIEDHPELTEEQLLSALEKEFPGHIEEFTQLMLSLPTSKDTQISFKENDTKNEGG